ncbi:hypothetical protein IL306_002626 [Fusarium sp. DS 682]|nr:hypothetical protein IL306_002626 [Fusarium sp. DS 682]
MAMVTSLVTVVASMVVTLLSPELADSVAAYVSVVSVDEPGSIEVDWADVAVVVVVVDSLDVVGMVEVSISVVPSVIVVASVKALLSPEAMVSVKAKLILDSDISVEMAVVALVVVEPSSLVVSVEIVSDLLDQVEVSRFPLLEVAVE